MKEKDMSTHLNPILMWPHFNFNDPLGVCNSSSYTD